MAGAILSFVVGGLAWAAPGKVTDPDVLSSLAAVRQATARYHDLGRVLADGYVALSPCVAEPGLGVMGIHFANLALAFDPGVSATSPEILLYVPTDGGLRLVGVEYFAFDVGQPAPQVFGRPMNGPMVHPGDPIPSHYDLHAWIWQGNRAGMFADFNPALSC
jgi:hypothetical protein